MHQWWDTIRAVLRTRFGLRFCDLVSTLVVLLLGGCAYRLPPAVSASENHIRIVATAPSLYLLRVNTDTTYEVRVPNDGRVTFTVPYHRSSCGVYLFDKVKVGGESDPLQQWQIRVLRNGKQVRKLSLRELGQLPADQAGYRLLTMHP
jgi:hypothetical protein